MNRVPRRLQQVTKRVVSAVLWRLERRMEAAAQSKRRRLWRAPLLVAAHLLARLRPVGRFPGWRFGIAEDAPGPRTRLRLAIWKFFQRSGLRGTLVMPWHGSMRVRLQIHNDLSRCLFVGGCIEPNEFALLERVLRPGMVVVDAGANEGLFTLFASGIVGSAGSVVACEPSRREFARLCANIRLNRLTNVRALRAGLSDSAGEAALRVATSRHAGQNTLGDFAHQDVFLSRVETVRLARLDRLAEALSLRCIDVIKIDVEGAELRVLRGARTVLERDHPLLLLELNDGALRQQGAGAAELVAWLREMGYEIRAFDEKGDAALAPADVAIDQLSENIVAVHPRRPWPGLS